MGAAAPVTAQSVKQSSRCFYCINYYYSSDLKRFHFGGTVGPVYTDSRIESDTRFGPVRNPDDPANPLVSVQPRSNLGINMGLLFNLKLTSTLDLRFIPAVSITQRNFDYFFRNGSKREFANQSVWVELPLYMRYKSNIYKDVQAYVQTGPKLNYNAASLEFARSAGQISLKPFDLAWTFAFGFTLYGEKVTLSPEVGYSFGFYNVYQPRDSDIRGAITSINTGMFTFSLHFE